MEVLSHVPAHARNGLQAMNGNKPLAHLNDDTRPQFARDVLNRYLDGEEIADIAKEHGVTKARLYQILIQGDQDAWKQSQAAKALLDHQETVVMMREAKDGLELARARELHKSAQWTLEKVLRRIYGDDKAAISITNEVVLGGDRETMLIEAARSVAYLLQQAQGITIDHENIPPETGK